MINMTKQEPPNLRYGDNCVTCIHGRNDWDGNASCKKYDMFTDWSHVCDDYVRDEDE